MISLNLPGTQPLRDFLNGQVMHPSLIGERRARALEARMHALAHVRFGRATRPDPRNPENGRSYPNAGLPAFLRPSPDHHLVAAKGLPPSDRTYLLPKD